VEAINQRKGRPDSSSNPMFTRLKQAMKVNDSTHSNSKSAQTTQYVNCSDTSSPHLKEDSSRPPTVEQRIEKETYKQVRNLELSEVGAKFLHHHIRKI